MDDLVFVKLAMNVVLVVENRSWSSVPSNTSMAGIIRVGRNVRSVKLTAHLHLVLSLRMREALFSLLHDALHSVLLVCSVL
jgi:hypothetical protein